MDDLRVFTLEGVNALLPRLSTLVGRQIERRAKIEKLLARLGRELGDVPERLAPDPGDSEETRQVKRDLARRIEQYRAGWREVEELGAVLKDAKTGLFDFYALVDGRLVWLCWRYGEAECAFYRPLEDGISGRKPIGPGVKQRLLN